MRRKKTYDMPPSFGIESDLQRNFMVCVCALASLLEFL